MNVSDIALELYSEIDTNDQELAALRKGDSLLIRNYLRMSGLRHVNAGHVYVELVALMDSGFTSQQIASNTKLLVCKACNMSQVSRFLPRKCYGCLQHMEAAL